jgi:hypothetical protein
LWKTCNREYEDFLPQKQLRRHRSGFVRASKLYNSPATASSSAVMCGRHLFCKD